MDISAAASQTEPVLVTNVSYEVASRGYTVDTPTFFVRARTASGKAHTFSVEGFRPYLGIEQTDLVANMADIANDRRVLGVEVDCSPHIWADTLGLNDDECDKYTPTDIAAHLTQETGADIYHDPAPFESLTDDPLVRIIATTPGDVGGRDSLRETLESMGIETFEADIPFERRFLISSEIYRGVKLDTSTSTVRYENWAGEQFITGDRSVGNRDGDALAIETRDCSAIEYQQELAPADPPDIAPRTIIYDIEVASLDGRFPDPTRADKPITAITAYDTQSDEYAFWGLAHEQWADERDEVESGIEAHCNERTDFPDPTVNTYLDETDMLEAFHMWVLQRNPDIFTGWNAGGQKGGFDTPYLIQRSYNVNARRIRDYTTTGDPATWVEEDSNGDQTHSYILQDRCTLDLLDAYRKTQYRELDSYSLDDVAEAELGYGKTGLEHDELDEAWAHRPVEFFTYNIRDTQATAGIDQEVGLIDLFENLREVTGATFDAAINNGPMLDTMFLRRAYENNLMLPTNTEPDENVYHGAKVFDTTPGVHQNCVYPDLSSMYPNLLYMLNLGTETIVGDADDLADSPYTAADCYQFPVDERKFAIVAKGKSIDSIDQDRYKGVKTPGGSVREMFDPQYDWFYVLKPDVRESFVTSVVAELIELKNQYTGSLYESVKRVTNSVYGILGDSASAGVGFRLYDRRVAEGITLAGRLTITHTAEQFTDYLQTNYDETATLVGGDTDSSVTSIPGAPTLQDAWQWSHEAVEYVDQSYDEFVQETFGFDSADEHRLHVELESLASRLFFLGGDTERSYTQTESGMLQSVTKQQTVKKRYAQHIVWDDDDGWLDTADPDDGYDGALQDTDDRSDLKYNSTVDYQTYETGPLSEQSPSSNVGIKGFEYVRSDSAQVTRDAQLRVLTDVLLTDTPRDRIEPYLQDLVTSIEDGEKPITALARPKGVSQHLDDYGWRDAADIDEGDWDEHVEEYGGRWFQRPSPTYRGAKYADDHFDWENFDGSVKVRKVPIKAIRNDDYPAVYQYESYPKKDRPRPPEVGDTVDAIAVENPERIPDGFIIDTDAIIEKTLKDRIQPILTTIGLDWSDLISDGQQSELDAFL